MNGDQGSATILSTSGYCSSNLSCLDEFHKAGHCTGFVGILGIVFSLGLFTSAVMGQPVWYWAGGTRTEQKTRVKLDRFGIAWRGSVRVPMVPWPCGPDCDPSLEPPCAATAVTTPHCVWVDGYLSACQWRANKSIPRTFQNINMRMVGDEWVPYFCVWSLKQRLASRVLSFLSAIQCARNTYTHFREGTSMLDPLRPSSKKSRMKKDRVWTNSTFATRQCFSTWFFFPLGLYWQCLSRLW